MEMLNGKDLKPILDELSDCLPCQDKVIASHLLEICTKDSDTKEKCEPLAKKFHDNKITSKKLIVSLGKLGIKVD